MSNTDKHGGNCCGADDAVSSSRQESGELLKCFNCSADETKAVLISCRKQGKDVWVCTRCLPMLIHG